MENGGILLIFLVFGVASLHIYLYLLFQCVVQLLDELYKEVVGIRKKFLDTKGPVIITDKNLALWEPSNDSDIESLADKNPLPWEE